MTRAHYDAETFIENRLDAPLKAIVGTNLGRKWPRFRTNDRKAVITWSILANDNPYRRNIATRLFSCVALDSRRRLGENRVLWYVEIFLPPIQLGVVEFHA